MIFPTLAYQYPLFREELLLVLCSQMEKLVVGLLKATRIPTLIASVDLNHRGFLGPLGSPQKIVVVPYPSLYRSEGNCPIIESRQLSNHRVASTIVSELVTHPSCSNLKLSGTIAPETFATGWEERSR